MTCTAKLAEGRIRSSRNGPQTALRLWLFALAAAITAVFGSISELMNNLVPPLNLTFTITALFVGVWLAAITFLWCRVNGGLDLFEPPVWLSLFAYTQFILLPALFRRSFYTTVPWLQDNYEMRMAHATLLICLGLSALWLGYAWDAKRRRAGAPKRRGQSIFSTYSLNRPLAWSCWAALAAIKCYIVVAGTTTYWVGRAEWAWGNYSFFIDLLYYLTWGALAFTYFHECRAPLRRAWLISSALLFVAESILVGSKGFLLTALWVGSIIWYAPIRLRISWIAPAVAFAAFYVPCITVFRQEMNLAAMHTDEPSASTRVTALRAAVSNLFNRGFGAMAEEAVDTASYRQGNLLVIGASVIEKHTSTEEFDGLQLARDFGDSLVPRLLWPGKPMGHSDTYLISTRYLGWNSESSFSEIGLINDSFRAGGVGCVMVLLFLTGWVAGLLYRLGPARGDPGGVVFYLVCLFYVVRLDTDLVRMALRLVQMVPFLLMWSRVLFTHHRSPIVPQTSAQITSPGFA